MSRSSRRVLWRNPGNPPDSVARALGIEPRRFSRALHKIKAASDLSGVDRAIIYSDGAVTDEGSRLATSTTKTDRKTFVTLRFAGDDLDPSEISAVLPIKPTRAHRKDEEFFAGTQAGALRGRTGMWFVATDQLVDSDDLADHFRLVEHLLYPTPGDPGRISKLREILDRAHSHARITCFWQGDRDQTAPLIPSRFKSAIEPLSADIETDFARDDR
jgi:hypothetical protein